MAKLLSIALFCVGLFPARGEIIFAGPPQVASNLITHSTAPVRWTNPAGVTTNKRVAFDTTAYFTANGQLRYASVYDGSLSYTGTIAIGLSGLAPNTSYTVCVLVRSATDATNCTSAGNANSRTSFTTLPLPSPHPALPHAPASWDTSYPGSFVTSLNVSPDCSNFTTVLNTAFGSSFSGQNVKVIVPSDRTVTGGAGACSGVGFPATKTGGGQVVIATSDEANIPPTDVRIDPSYGAAGFLVTLRAAVPSQPATSMGPGTMNTRLVGFRFAPANGPQPGDGNPSVQNYLVRFDSGVTGLIFDRSVFDCGGYPYRVQHTAYGKGSNIAFLSSYWNNCEIWKGWTTTAALTHPTPARLNVASFLIGRGNQVDSVGSFSVVLNGTTGTGHMVLYEEPGGIVTLKYDTGSPISSCTGITCTLDASLTVPRGGILFTYESINTGSTFPYTNGKFADASGNPEPGIFSNQPIDLLSQASGVSFISEWDSNGPEIDGVGATTSQNWKLYNNWIGVTGFGFFPQGDGSMSIHELDVVRNTFSSDNAALLASTPTRASNPYTATRRQHIELKNGYNVRIEGNTLQNGWIGVGGNTAAAISLKRDLATIPPTNRTGDLLIQNNTFLNEPSCLYIAGDYGGGSTQNYTLLISRVAVINNLCENNGSARALWAIPQGTLTNGGFFIWADQMSEDLIMRHNTTYQQRGFDPAILLRTDQCGDGLSMTDNIFFIHNSGSPQYRGIAAGRDQWGDAIPRCTVDAGSDGTVALQANYPTGYTVTGNVFIAGCVDSTTCTDATSGSSLVGDLSGQYPPGNQWIVSPATFGARQDAVRWTNRVQGLFSLAATSGYNAGGHHSSDGTDPGINLAVMQAAAGVIQPPRETNITPASATISFNAPGAGISCQVAYNTSGVPPWSRTSADTTNRPNRNITVSGLSPGTTYKYQVWCAGSAPTATRSFTIR